MITHDHEHDQISHLRKIEHMFLQRIVVEIKKVSDLVFFRLVFEAGHQWYCTIMVSSIYRERTIFQQLFHNFFGSMKKTANF